MSRLKIAAYSAAGCGGCDIAILDINERILDLIAVADILFWPTVVDAKYADIEALEDGAIDACFFNGAIRTEENADVARLLRAKSKVLVAFGACASFGGVPGLGNLFETDDVVGRAFSTQSCDAGMVAPPPGTDEAPGVPAMREWVGNLADVVDVDYFLPGCAPEADRVWDVCAALAAGELPPLGSVVGAGERSVCDECSRPKRNTRVARFVRPHEVVPEPDWCLLEQGIVCVGPATRSGCGAKCPAAAMPCRGCYGPAGDTRDVGAKMIAALGALVDSEDEATIIETIRGVADPAGTFYCFTMPSSIMGHVRTAPAPSREEAPQ